LLSVTRLKVYLNTNNAVIYNRDVLTHFSLITHTIPRKNEMNIWGCTWLSCVGHLAQDCFKTGDGSYELIPDLDDYMNQVATSKEPTGATGTSAPHKKVHLWSLSLYPYNCINIICMYVTIVVFQRGNNTFVELGVGVYFHYFIYFYRKQ